MTKTTETSSAAPAFTDEERAAMKERSKEVKTARKGKTTREDDTRDLLAKIAELPEHDRSLAERIHTIVTETVPDVWPKLWYGQPAYAIGGKTFCFFQPASKFKTRYSTLGFNDPAKLDDGPMWATAFAILDLGPEEEQRVRELVGRAAG
ncbi:iron chaperone [Leifsonia sp. NPDC014704]|uniref:iron chaperone n=1 Tax=Leifsonia sp. NPDC014704 TaxID=3364123 RepID=UPI0036F4B03B